MVYECDQCHAALSPGMRYCGQCGQKFDEPVPEGLNQPSANNAAQVSALPQKNKSRVLLPVLGCGGLLTLLVVVGIVGGSSDHKANTVNSGSPDSSQASYLQPAHVMSNAERRAAVLKAHQQAMTAAKQAKAKAEQDKKEAEQAKEKAREEAQQQKLQDLQQAREQAEVNQQQQEDADAFATIKAKVQHDYPDDYITQKGVYDMAVSAYQFMKTIPDDEIKRKVETDYPDDYITQKGVYEMAVKAKQDMQ